MKKRFLPPGLFLSLSLAGLVGCSQLSSNPPATYSYRMPDAIPDGWTVATLQSQQINPQPIEQLTDLIVTERYRNIHSLLIARRGKLVYENYFNGYTQAVPENIYSATKSITSVLIGIALDKGFIKSLDDKLLDYFPQYSSLPNLSADKKQITIRNLLTMSSGLACNDDDPESPGREAAMYQSKDWIRHVLSLPTENTPGGTTHYCTGGVALLGGILEQATGVPVDEFARQHLLEPLAIRPVRWDRMPTGQVNTSGRMFMRPRDMARIGQLLLAKGQWQGRQLLSAGWAEESTRKQVLLRNQEYGYLWWRRPITVATRTYSTYYASGNGGQFILIVPEEDLVVVTTAGNLNSGLTGQLFGMLQAYILPAL